MKMWNKFCWVFCQLYWTEYIYPHGTVHYNNTNVKLIALSAILYVPSTLVAVQCSKSRSSSLQFFLCFEFAHYFWKKDTRNNSSNIFIEAEMKENVTKLLSDLFLFPKYFCNAFKTLNYINYVL